MYSSKTKYCVFLLLVQILISCEENRSVEYTTYIDIDSLISQNAAYFARTRPALEKQARINDKIDTTLVKPADSISWSRELEILRQITSINDPVNRGSYAVEDKLDDRQSNLTVCQYTAVEDLPVRAMRIYYMQKRPEIRKIEAEYNEKNALYSSSRFFTVKLHKVYNNILITSYSVSGRQKMILDDSVNFDLTGKIIFERSGKQSSEALNDPDNN